MTKEKTQARVIIRDRLGATQFDEMLIDVTTESDADSGHLIVYGDCADGRETTLYVPSGWAVFMTEFPE